MKRTSKEIQNEASIKALKRARLALALSRAELGQRLGVSDKAIEKYENGRDIISPARLSKILEALELTEKQFFKIKRGKNFQGPKKREKKVLANIDRRSYQRNITKECKVLRSLRRMKRLSQDEASKLCGYSRTAIGHIENGRIELTRSRIEHILSCYELQYKDFEEAVKSPMQRDQLEDFCIKSLQTLETHKMALVKGILESFEK